MANVVSQEEWRRARLALWEEERRFTRERDALSARRRELPWVLVEKDYRFDTEQGEQSLAELFGEASQLLVYHFMYGPEWEAGCPSCSFWADGYNGITDHLSQRDIRLIAASRGPLEKLLAYRERMGLSFPWVSAPGDFNFDYNVSFSTEQVANKDGEYNYRAGNLHGEEMPGLSVFALEGGQVFHTYSCYSRGLDIFNSAYHLMDMAPKGRDEDELSYPMAWVKRRDEYERSGA